jgi:hypothetical protein
MKDTRRAAQNAMRVRSMSPIRPVIASRQNRVTVLQKVACLHRRRQQTAVASNHATSNENYNGGDRMEKAY